MLIRQNTKNCRNKGQTNIFYLEMLKQKHIYNFESNTMGSLKRLLYLGINGIRVDSVYSGEVKTADPTRAAECLHISWELAQY